MSMILHHAWRSSASYRVRIALALKGIEAEYRHVDLVAGEQESDTFLVLNRQGLVPVLEAGNLRIAQSFAIIDYLEAAKPEPRLLPKRPAARALALSIAFGIAMDIHPVCNLRVLKRIDTLAGADARVAWARDTLASGLDTIEALLSENSLQSGDAPGAVELSLVPLAYNAARWSLDLARWPKVSRIDAECRALPAFASAHPDRFRPT